MNRLIRYYQSIFCFIRKYNFYNKNDELDHQFRERNKESAKNSRERKKYYIQLLEKKVEELQSEVNKYKQILNENSKYFN